MSETTKEDANIEHPDYVLEAIRKLGLSEPDYEG
jgi:hypothetical protein